MQARVEHGDIADELGQFLSQKAGGGTAASASRGLKQDRSASAVTVPRLPSDLREASKIASVEDELLGCGGCAADPCGEGDAQAKKMPISMSQAAGREMPETAYCYVSRGATDLRDDSARLSSPLMPALQCNFSIYGLLLLAPLVFFVVSGSLDSRPASAEHPHSPRNSSPNRSSQLKLQDTAHSSEELSKSIEFQTGTLGMNVDNITGAVLSVSRGSAAFDAGVKEGWNISRIDQAPFDIEVLKQKVTGNAKYKLTFVTTKDPHHSVGKMRDLRDPEVVFGTMGHKGASHKHGNAEPYDCSTRGSWSQVKQEWCCNTHGKQCPSSTPEPFSCQEASIPDWSPAQQVYCCVHHQIHCHDFPDVAEAVKVKPVVTFDCKSGLWDFKKRWSPDKQVWCCLHKGVACPRMFK